MKTRKDQVIAEHKKMFPNSELFKPQHTSTPWSISKAKDKSLSIKNQTVFVANMIMQLDDKEKANAEFIVRAVNAYEGNMQELAKLRDSHEELLASLKEYKEAARNGKAVTLGMARRSGDAIAKAEGK